MISVYYPMGETSLNACNSGKMPILVKVIFLDVFQRTYGNLMHVSVRQTRRRRIDRRQIQRNLTRDFHNDSIR